MIVGAALIELHVHGSQSLKQKRGVVRSITQRVRNRFNLAVPLPIPVAVPVELAQALPVVDDLPPEKQLEDFPALQEQAVHLPVPG